MDKMVRTLAFLWRHKRKLCSEPDCNANYHWISRNWYQETIFIVY